MLDTLRSHAGTDSHRNEKQSVLRGNSDVTKHKQYQHSSLDIGNKLAEDLSSHASVTLGPSNDYVIPGT